MGIFERAPTLKVFIGQPIDATRGGWIELPFDGDLEIEIENLIGENKDYIIADIDTNLSLDKMIKEHSNIYAINDQMELLDTLFYIRDLSFDRIDTAIQASDKFDEALELLDNENYHYFEGIEDEEDLGLSIVGEGFIDVPEHLTGYIDYEGIGRDWCCNGTFITKDLGTAIQVLP